MRFRDLAPATDAAQRALGEIAPTNIFDNFATELTKAYANLSPLKKFACKAGDWWRESAIGRTIALASGAVAGTSVITGGVAFLATGGAATYGVGIALAAIIAATQHALKYLRAEPEMLQLGTQKQD